MGDIADSYFYNFFVQIIYSSNLLRSSLSLWGSIILLIALLEKPLELRNKIVELLFMSIYFYFYKK
jgi:hypothetical protein